MSTITDRFADSTTGKKPTFAQLEAVDTIRRNILDLAFGIQGLVPVGRHQSLALTALEDVQMRANRAIFTDWPAGDDDPTAGDVSTPLGDSPAPRFDVNAIAGICHEANRELQRVLGETPNRSWASSGSELRDSAKAGVITAQNGATSEQLHEAWAVERASNGWVYGDVKDFNAKTHPCLVPYDELPETQRAKDALFGAIVKALS